VEESPALADSKSGRVRIDPSRPMHLNSVHNRRVSKGCVVAGSRRSNLDPDTLPDRAWRARTNLADEEAADYGFERRGRIKHDDIATCD
jgi:hypothetical protein